MIQKFISAALIGVTTMATAQAAPKPQNSWRVDSADEWNSAGSEVKGLAVENDLLSPTGKEGTYHSKLQRFENKRSAQAMTLTASTKWDNWKPTKKKVCPPTLADAPIMRVKGPGDD